VTVSEELLVRLKLSDMLSAPRVTVSLTVKETACVMLSVVDMVAVSVAVVEDVLVNVCDRVTLCDPAVTVLEGEPVTVRDTVVLNDAVAVSEADFVVVRVRVMVSDDVGDTEADRVRDGDLVTVPVVLIVAVDVPVEDPDDVWLADGVIVLLDGEMEGVAEVVLLGDPAVRLVETVSDCRCVLDAFRLIDDEKDSDGVYVRDVLRLSEAVGVLDDVLVSVEDHVTEAVADAVRDGPLSVADNVRDSVVLSVIDVVSV
jgi:hypothetical protein